MERQWVGCLGDFVAKELWPCWKYCLGLPSGTAWLYAVFLWQQKPKMQGQSHVLWKRPKQPQCPSSSWWNHSLYLLSSYILRNGFLLTDEFAKSVSAVLTGSRPLLEEFNAIHWHYTDAALGPACCCYLPLIYCVQMVQATQIYKSQGCITVSEHTQVLPTGAQVMGAVRCQWEKEALYKQLYLLPLFKEWNAHVHPKITCVLL